jgi:hypothetical protein
MKRREKKTILKFKDFVNENVDEFVTATMTEDDFVAQLDQYKDKNIVVNDEVLLSKAKEDGFKGDLRPVKSKKTGKVVLIYRPSINIGSTLATAESKVNESDAYGDAEDLLIAAIPERTVATSALSKIEPFINKAEETGEYDMDEVKAALSEFIDDEGKLEDLVSDLDSSVFYVISLGMDD